MLPFGLIDHPQFLVGQGQKGAGVADGNQGFEIGLCEAPSHLPVSNQPWGVLRPSCPLGTTTSSVPTDMVDVLCLARRPTIGSESGGGFGGAQSTRSGA